MKHIFMMHHSKRHHDFEKKIHQYMSSLTYEVIYTNSIAESQKFILQQQDTRRFYLVGGDGTINGLLQVLVHTSHEVVILPLGTGNDFCRSLTKEKDPCVLLKRSLSLSCQKVDTVLLNEHYYINAACFGLDSVIANHVHDMPHIPFIPQSKSYVLSVLRHVWSYRYHQVKIVSEHQCLFQGRTTLCTVNNAQYYGGGFQIIPQADIQDGYIDICVVDQVPLFKIPYLLIYLLSHRLNRRREVHYYRVKKATFYCQQSANVDGEEMSADRYDFQVCPQSLNLVVYENMT